MVAETAPPLGARGSWLSRSKCPQIAALNDGAVVFEESAVVHVRIAEGVRLDETQSFVPIGVPRFGETRRSAKFAGARCS
jgi:hypothetical protein